MERINKSEPKDRKEINIMLTTPIHRNEETLLIIDGLKVLNHQNKTIGRLKVENIDKEEKKYDQDSKTEQTLTTNVETDFEENRKVVLERTIVNIPLTKPSTPRGTKSFQKGTISVEPYLRKVVERFIQTDDTLKRTDNIRQEQETTTIIRLTTPTTTTTPTIDIEIIKDKSRLEDKIRQFTDRGIGIYIYIHIISTPNKKYILSMFKFPLLSPIPHFYRYSQKLL